ncbi:MAG: hypothetical protein Q9219_001689 [cf. Caloplaca sp. 3 TL-2023]
MADPTSEHPAPSANEATVNDVTEIDTLDGPVEAADEVIAEGETPHPLDAFVDFQVYRVDDTVVDRARTMIYQQQRENLFQRENISFHGFEWVLRFRWVNEFDTEHTYTTTVQQGLTIAQGQETERNFGISGSFKGLGISAGGSRKNFSSVETSRIETIEKKITVPARSTVWFYQKQYKFSTAVWWGQHVPEWREHNYFTVGVNGGGRTITRTAETLIFAEEYASLLRSLNGSTTIQAQRAPNRTDEPPVRRQFVNIRENAKRWLQARGVTGAG